MKRFLSLIFAVCLTAVLTVSVSAASNKLSATAPAGELKAGDTVKVTVSLSTEEAFKSIGLTMMYDSNTFSLESGSWLLKGTVLKDVNESRNQAAAAFTSEKTVRDDIFEFTLKVKSGAYTDSYTVAVEPVLKNGSNVIPTDSASVTVKVFGIEPPTSSEAATSSEIVSSDNTSNTVSSTVSNSSDAPNASGGTASDNSSKDNTSSETSNHVHSFGDFVIDIPASCYEFGVKSRHCAFCGSCTDITKIDATGHNWSDWVVGVEASTEEAGLKTRSCNNSGCTEKQTAEIAKLSADGHTHSFGEWEIIMTATCTRNGQNVRVCSICGEQEKIDIICEGHKYGDWTIKVAPTTEKEGQIECVCTVCSDKQTQTVQKLNSGDESYSNTSPSTDGNPKDTNGASSRLTLIIVLAAVVAAVAVVVVIVAVRSKKK